MTGGFPADDYTPHGYLANPLAVAHSWTDGSGGCLRSSRDAVGFGWQLPWALKAQASADLVVELASGGRSLSTRPDFAGADLTAPRHSAILFVYQWRAFGRRWEATYTLVEPPTRSGRLGLGLRLNWEPLTDLSTDLPDVTVSIALVGWRQDQAVAADPDARTVDLGPPLGRYKLLVDAEDAEQTGHPTEVHRRVEVRRSIVGAEAGSVCAVAQALTNELVPGDATAATSPTPAGIEAGEPAMLASAVIAAIARARAEDDAFWSGATRLDGDWPATWRRGWVYDLETTRMCVFPAGGIFSDVWPSWMIQWPRAVVAEGTLDMARLAYADPALAQRAVLSLFRDATAANVPCVFQYGEPNMIAADGSICGTSPAWCVPFHNLERLFAFTLDGGWLAAIYPFLVRYVEWWLAERTDPDGWAVYTCTWEAGEDDTPRLDPERRGDNVVSAFVRPVELQATLAQAAGVLARFAAVLGDTSAVERWRTVEADYLERTRSLWDPNEGRFRDWDVQAGRFLGPSGESNYWGVDVCRYSALAFTPALAGLGGAGYAPGLRRELQAYDGPPWTLWASWSYVVLEAALALGERDFAARIAAGIVGRVYDELDTREIASPAHPTPGVAREYWPLDLAAWASCEGYGWGANTASLLVRQVFGFLESPYLMPEQAPPPAPPSGDAEAGQTHRLPSLRGGEGSPGGEVHHKPLSPLRFRLAPGLPPGFLIAGREYWLRTLPYRGVHLDVGYRVEEVSGADGAAARLSILIQTPETTRCRVRDADGRAYYDSGRSRRLHHVPALNGAHYDVVLTPAN